MPLVAVRGAARRHARARAHRPVRHRGTVAAGDPALRRRCRRVGAPRALARRPGRVARRRPARRDAHGPHRHQQFAAPARRSQAPCAPATSGAHDRGRRSRARRSAATAGDDPRRAQREARRVRGRPLRARGRPSGARLQARRARAAHPARRGIGRDRRAERRRPRGRHRSDHVGTIRPPPRLDRRPAVGDLRLRTPSRARSADGRHTRWASSSRSTPGSTTH